MTPGNRDHIKHKRFFTPFSIWCADNLPHPNTGYMVGDLDKIFYNEPKRRLMMVEEKCRNVEPKAWFHKLIREVIHPALAKRCAEIGVEYRGFHLIQFEKERPDDGGKILLNRREVTVEELLSFLRMDEEAEDRELEETLAIGRSLG